MVEALARRRRKAEKAQDDAHARELKRLCLAMCDDLDFRLYLATYDHAERRDELIARLIRDAARQRVKVTRLHLPSMGPVASLVGALREHMRDNAPPDGWRHAVAVTGIEERLDLTGKRHGVAFLRQANLLRDTLSEAAPVPVVLWLPRMTSAVLPAEAPDLWHWRAASFDFTGNDTPRAEVLRELIMLDLGQDLSPGSDRSRARLEILENLLAELERTGPPRSKRQMAERAGLLVQWGKEAARLGRAQEAVTAIQRALPDICHAGDRWAEAPALGILGMALSQLGRREDALAASDQAVALYRELAAARPDAFMSELASALNNLGADLSVLGREEEALAASQEVAIRRELAGVRPDAFKPDLARALDNHGIRLITLGRREEALAASEEAVKLYHELATARPDAFKPDLAMLLNNLGAHLSALGRREEALAATDEAVAISRELAAARPDAFKPHLAMLLNNLGAHLSALGRREEALAATDEAVAIRRELAAARPDAFKPDLARALDKLGKHLSDLERREEALAASEEAVRTLAPRFLALPAAFAGSMATMVQNYRERAGEVGVEPDAALLGPIEEKLRELEGPGR